MRQVLNSPGSASLLGTAAALLILAFAALSAGLDIAQVGAALARVLHVLAAIVWGGFIVFVNLVQLTALAAASDAERPVIVRHVVPRTARVFAIAADVTLATGVVLTLPAHATLAARPLLLAGILGGLAMWAIVRFVLKPAVAIVTGARTASDPERAAARGRIALYARINLVLLLPVTTAMLLGAHGFG